MLLEQLEDAHLVLERVDAVVERAAVAAEVERDGLAAALDVEEPGGPPARLALPAHDAAAELASHPLEGASPLGLEILDARRRSSLHPGGASSPQE